MDSVVRNDKMRERREQTYTLERNVLGVPTFVLNTKAAEKVSNLEHSWNTPTGKVEFKYTRTLTPFPQIEHARYFDVLVGLFATRFNPGGDLWFSIAEGLRFSGLNANNRGARKALLEAIRRYQFCSAAWIKSWIGHKETWTGHLIEYSDIWDEDTGELKRNPRSSRRAEALHHIQFHEQVVASIKDGKVRVFLTDSIKKLKPDAYAVYRYFYGFSNQSVVHRDLDYLMTVFPWLGQKNRFLPWLEARLQEAFDKGFIETFEIKDKRVFVKCKSLREYKDSAPVIALQSRPKKNPHRKGAEAKPKRMDAQNIAPETLLEEYYLRKSSGQLNAGFIDVIDTLLAQKGAHFTKMAIESLRSRL